MYGRTLRTGLPMTSSYVTHGYQKPIFLITSKLKRVLLRQRGSSITPYAENRINGDALSRYMVSSKRFGRLVKKPKNLGYHVVLEQR